VLPGVWQHIPIYHFESIKPIVKECPFEYDQKVTLLVTPRVRNHAVVAPFTGAGMGESYVTVGNEYLCDCNWPKIVKGWKGEDFASEYNKVQVQEAFVHEFAHGLGGFADEYSIGDTNSLVPAWLVPNCDSNGLLGEPACGKWDSKAAHSCEPGCGYSNWYKPYLFSMMYNHTIGYDFMPVNEQLLREDINSWVSEPATSQFSYQWDVNINDGNIISSNISLVHKKASNRVTLEEKGYPIKVMGGNGLELLDFNFNFPLNFAYSVSPDWFDENGSQTFFPGEEQVETVPDANISLFIPYLPEAESLEIYDLNNNHILSENVSKLKPVKYTIAYEAKSLVSNDYNILYNLTQQPTKKLLGADYNILLGFLNIFVNR